jgi:hypothetical protein
MALKNKTKVYLSFSKEMLLFLDAEAKQQNITRTKFINNVLGAEYEKKKKELIDNVIEGKN